MNMLRRYETLSPLTLIRQKESEMTQQLLAAQNEAAQAITQARKRAQAMIAQAAQDGQQAGAAEREVMLKVIEQEAQAILAQAQTAAEKWQAEEEARVETAVTQLVSDVCGSSIFTERHMSDSHRTKERRS